MCYYQDWLLNLKSKTDRIIGVGVDAGSYYPVSLKREFIAPSVTMDFYVGADRLDVADLSENELKQYISLLGKLSGVSLDASL